MSSFEDAGRSWIVVGSGIVVAFVSNLLAVNLSFLSDDYVLLTAIERGGIGAVWTVNSGFLRPVVSTSLKAELWLFGMNPMGFHISNLLVHSVNSALVGLIAMTMIRLRGTDSNPRLASVCGIGSAVLFAVLPTHTEATAWISGRTDLLVTLFSLATIQLFLVMRRRPRFSVWACAICCCILALLSKENALALPLALVVIEWSMARGGMIAHGAVRRVLPFLMLLPAYLCARRVLLGHWVGGYGSDAHLDVSLIRLGYNFVRFAVRSFIPGDVTAAVISHPALGGTVTVLLTCGMLLFLRNRVRGKQAYTRLLVGMVITYCLFLAPVLNLYVSVLSGEGERFIYLPSAFACIALTLVLTHFSTSRSICLLAAAALASGVLLQVALGHWQSASRIADRVLATTLQADRGSKSITVLALPDSIRGAFVFRNGFLEAVEHTTGGKWNVQVISRVLLPDESATVTCTSSDKTLHLTGSTPGMSFFSGFIDPHSNLVSPKFGGQTPNHGFDLRHRSLRIDFASFEYSQPPLCYSENGLHACDCALNADQR